MTQLIPTMNEDSIVQQNEGKGCPLVVVFFLLLAFCTLSK